MVIFLGVQFDECSVAQLGQVAAQTAAAAAAARELLLSCFSKGHALISRSAHSSSPQRSQQLGKNRQEGETALS